MNQISIHQRGRSKGHARRGQLRIVLLLGLLLGAALVAAAGLASAKPAEAAALLKGSFRGDAYGTFANTQAGPVSAELGRSAYQPCPCPGTGGKTLSNTVEAVSAGQDGRVLTADAVRSTVFTSKTSNSARVRNASNITGLDLLDGLITADAVGAVADTSANAKTITGTPNGSTFVNLEIAGRSIGANPAPNTRINLAGIGSVTLKKTAKLGNGKSYGGIVVEALVVDVTRVNTLGLPIGTRIIVGHARSAFTRTVPEIVVGGQAYAATAGANAGEDLQNRVGKAAAIYMGCEGTNGKTNTNNVEEIDAGEVLSLGTGRTTAFGGPTSYGAVARTSAAVEDVDLLGGLIGADAVTSVVKDTFTSKNGKRTQSFEGTRFANLTVLNVPVPVNVAPNTRLALPGIGYVVVNEQIRPPAGSTARVQANGLRIVVNQNNLLGLPVGAQIVVAHADATAKRF